MKFKGTKGGWHCVEYSGFFSPQSGFYYGDKNLLDCEEFPREEVEANAKLIASAPELLEALQLAVLCSDFEEAKKKYGDSENHWTNKIEKAINKALK